MKRNETKNAWSWVLLFFYKFIFGCTSICVRCDVICSNCDCKHSPALHRSCYDKIESVWTWTYLYGCLAGSTNIIFSGFKSAWMSPSCFNFNKAVKTYKRTSQIEMKRGKNEKRKKNIGKNYWNWKCVWPHECQIMTHTCCKIGRMNFNGSGENLFCFKKSYKFCSSISNTKHVWFLCWKHSNARTKLNSSAFSWLRRDNIDTSIWPWRAYDGWFFNILMATISLVPRFQHLTTCPNVPRPKNSSTCNEKKREKTKEKKELINLLF